VSRIAGSHPGSQQSQILSDTTPRPASIGAAKRHVRPHLASSGDGSSVAFWTAGRGANPARCETSAGRSSSAADGTALLGNCPEQTRAVAARIWDRTPSSESSMQQVNQLGMMFARLDCTPRWRAGVTANERKTV